MDESATPAPKVTAWTPWKQWLIHDILSVIIFLGVTVLLIRLQTHQNVVTGLFFTATMFLCFRAVLHVLGILSVCTARRAIRNENPSLSVQEQNEAMFLSNMEKSIKTRREEVKDKKFLYSDVLLYSCMFILPSRHFWRTYFSIRRELVDEWTEKLLELMGGSNINNFGKFEEYMDKLNFGKIGDFFAFKKFVISDLIMWLWILASAGDIYAFFKYLKVTMEEGPFVLLLLLSLLAIRIICEYTVVLFSIADLTREVRDELRASNAKKAAEQNEKDALKS